MGNRFAMTPEVAEGHPQGVMRWFDLGELVSELPGNAVTALFCLEREPEACHRSLVAACLHTEHGLPVTDLRPA